MTDERRRILDLVAQQKITVEEAEQLLNAVSRPTPGADPAEPRRKPKYVRIAVHKKAAESPKNGELDGSKVWQDGSPRDKDVSIRVPMAFVRSGLRLGAMIPGLGDSRLKARLRERGIDIDLSKLDPVMLESMLEDLGELNIDVDSGRAQVRITAE